MKQYRVAVVVGSLREQVTTVSWRMLWSLFSLHIQGVNLSVSVHCRSIIRTVDAQPPAEVLAFKQQISQADGVIFVTPSITVLSGCAEKRTGSGLPSVGTKQLG